eukprot:CAMPEP_0114234446 /NCGR_PEP_ID=MMETSP0058-20121206/5715_1 /TAXON_ID=36894 /ORGANISM="Pyramimonas parkeae, CCMP726" /LENGTH=466 /DNA_ID=CAMNT_0001346129 /DNA_START=148 /DNA_END=1548 /DNA_ORIENTATION=+
MVLEMSTPYFADPNGMLFCLTTPGALLQNVTLMRLEEGGSQFEEGRVWVDVDKSMGLRASPFFQEAAYWQHRPVEWGTVPDVLGLDPHYARNYIFERYDDLVTDARGNSLEGLVRRLSEGNSSEVDAVLERIAAKDALSEAEARAALEELAEAGRPAGNCALVTGNWKRNRRYAMQASFVNPSTVGQALSFWMAPVTYNWTNDAKTAVTYRVRADKRGQMCPPKEVQRQGESEVMNTTIVEAGLNESSGILVRPTECPNGTVFGNSVYGGECVSCAPQGVVSDGACECNSSAMSAPAGGSACGPPYGLDAVSAHSLGEALCEAFTVEYKMLLDGEISDLVVSKEYLALFVEQAKPIMDTSMVEIGNLTFWANLLFDERRPEDPSRTRGILPGCSKCDTDGTFIDYATGEVSRPQDHRYQSIHTLRLIGYLLYQAGYACTTLFDVNDKFRKFYGSWEDAYCGVAMPS